jgi:hypothetical protein
MSNPKKKDETKKINPIQKKSNKQKITKNNKNHDNNCSGSIIYAGSSAGTISSITSSNTA